VYGTGIATELARHGYRLSFGTLYPVLHGLEESGFLVRHSRLVDGKQRKYYRITKRGTWALDEARQKAVELVDELIEVRRSPSP
jgi:DNA-binding PadR family transcriptional regulator